MIRWRLTLAALLVLAAAPGFAQTPAPNVTGDWDVTVNSPQGANTTLVTFTQVGEKVSGIFKSQRGELPFEGGTLTGNDLTFTFTRTGPLFNRSRILEAARQLALNAKALAASSYGTLPHWKTSC